MIVDGLDKLVASGRKLLDENHPAQAHIDFNRWVDEVSEWINIKSPDSGLSAAWSAQGFSNLVFGNHYSEHPSAWSDFRQKVNQRLTWLADLPQKVQSKSKIGNIPETLSKPYVNLDRINQFKSLPNNNFDLCKLIRLCEELNICFAQGCYFSTMMLMRAILDHVPPILGCSNFSEVANNYTGAKSFKEATQHLEKCSRKISDSYLHTQIRISESLPNETQVNFSADLDFLLAEITRILRG